MRAENLDFFSNSQRAVAAESCNGHDLRRDAQSAVQQPRGRRSHRPSHAVRGKGRRVVLETSRPRAAREEACVDGRAARWDSSTGAKKSIANSRLKKETAHVRGPEETHLLPSARGEGDWREAENLRTQDKARERDAKNAEEEVVENVTEKCTNNTSRSDQHRRSRILRGCGSAKDS